MQTKPWPIAGNRVLQVYGTSTVLQLNVNARNPIRKLTQVDYRRPVRVERTVSMSNLHFPEK